MTDDDKKEEKVMAPGFYMLEVSFDTLIFKKMRVPHEKKEELPQDDQKKSLCFERNEIDLSAE